jgi:protocatechuate 3,4-dioxygenase beta subunit
MLIQRSATYAVSHNYRREATQAAAQADPVDVFVPTEQQLEPTQQDLRGQQYYRAGAPQRQWLQPLGEPGERFWMPGSVRNTAGAPLEGAKVEFWVTNDAGEYSQDDFAGRGSQATSEDGSYQLHCVRPGQNEEGRPTWVNARVSAPGYKELNTRLFFEDDIHNWKEPGFEKARELELGSLHWGSYKYFTAEFDFILQEKGAIQDSLKEASLK